VEKANNKLKVISTVQTDHLIALLDVADDRNALFNQLMPSLSNIPSLK